jgi:hypothetical protein
LPVDPAERWRGAVDAVKAVSVRHGRSLSFGRLVGLKPGEVLVAFTKEAAFHRATVMGTSRGTIEQALSTYFGVPTKIAEDLSQGAADRAPLSIAELEVQHREAREKGLESKIRSHPAVKSALRILGGEVEHIQVLEPERPPAPDRDPVDDR